MPAQLGGSGSSQYLLAIDLGPTNTVAMVRRPDGGTGPLLFDGEPVLPSCVLAEADGTIRVGREADRRAPADPGRFEAAPRERLAESSVRLGDRDAAPTELLAAVLGAVATAASGALGGLPPTALTYPVAWSEAEQAELGRAAELAGFPGVTLIPEPVAAAHSRLLAVGARLAVVDVGARRFDVAVVEYAAEGPVVIAVGSDPTIGGRRLDAAIAAHLASSAGRQHREVWRAIDRPQDEDQRRIQRAFWDEVRAAKETVGRTGTGLVLLPGSATPITLTGEDLVRLGKPLVERVVRVTGRVLREARTKPSELDGVLLVGGSARLAALPPALRRALGSDPLRADEPEWVVATGALEALAATLGSAPVPPVPLRRPAPGQAVTLSPHSRRVRRSLRGRAQAVFRSGRGPSGALPAPPVRPALPAPRHSEEALPAVRPTAPPTVPPLTPGVQTPAPDRYAAPGRHAAPGRRPALGVLALGAGIVLLLVLAVLVLVLRL